MAQAKTEEFTKEEVYLAEIAKALSHPARIKILKILNDLNTCMCGDIVDNMPLSQSTVSQHLKELKSVGLIRGNVDGPKTCYCIDKKALEDAKSALHTLFSKINSCCS